jgi:hypothetical protein
MIPISGARWQCRNIEASSKDEAKQIALDTCNDQDWETEDEDDGPAEVAEVLSSDEAVQADRKIYEFIDRIIEAEERKGQCVS